VSVTLKYQRGGPLIVASVGLEFGPSDGEIVLLARFLEGEGVAYAFSNSARIAMRNFLGEQKPKLKFCGAVPDIRGARALKPLRHQLQIKAQLFVALFYVVSNFAALKIRDQRIGDPSPSHPLPFLQLNYFAAQNIRLSHADGPYGKLDLS